MDVGMAGHLRQVGHGEDLSALRETLELPAQGRGLGAADARVHLVEHQGGPRLLGLATGGELQREMDARELAAGGDAGQRPGLLPRVRSELEDDLVQTVAAERSEEHTSELQSPCNLVCRLLLEKKHTVVADTLTCYAGALA